MPAKSSSQDWCNESKNSSLRHFFSIINRIESFIVLIPLPVSVNPGVKQRIENLLLQIPFLLSTNLTNENILLLPF